MLLQIFFSSSFLSHTSIFVFAWHPKIMLKVEVNLFVSIVDLHISTSMRFYKIGIYFVSMIMRKKKKSRQGDYIIKIIYYRTFIHRNDVNDGVRLAVETKRLFWFVCSSATTRVLETRHMYKNLTRILAELIKAKSQCQGHRIFGERVIQEVHLCAPINRWS